MKITQEKLKLGIARDGNVEGRVGFCRVTSELSPSEVPVELDSLVMVVGEVDGFGARAGFEE